MEKRNFHWRRFQRDLVTLYISPVESLEALFADIRFSWEGRPLCRPTNHFPTAVTKRKIGRHGGRPSLKSTNSPLGEARPLNLFRHHSGRGQFKDRAPYKYGDERIHCRMEFLGK